MYVYIYMCILYKYMYIYTCNVHNGIQKRLGFDLEDGTLKFLPTNPGAFKQLMGASGFSPASKHGAHKGHQTPKGSV